MWREAKTVEYAGFRVRLAAGLIDGLILAAIWFTVMVILGPYDESPNTPLPIPVAMEEAATYSHRTVAVMVYLIVSVVYWVLFWTWRGQTPGKMAMGIKIVRTDGSPIGLGRSVLRCIGYTISSFIFLIGHLWIVIDPEKQGIYDKIASTYVVRLPRKRGRLVQLYE